MDALGGISAGIVSALFLFLAADRLGIEGSASSLLLIYFLSGAVFVTPIVRLSYRLGKHRALAASAFFNAATLPLLFLVPRGNVTVALFLFILLGMNMGAGPFLFRAIMADVADHDRVTSGAQRTGLYFSLLMMTNKVGYAVSIGIVYPLLDWIGYQPGATNTASAIAGLSAIYVWPATICSLAIALKMWRFPLDRERQLELRRTIEAQEHVRSSERAQGLG
jgi:Na+/melibiose symporter-like transporter